LREKLDSIRALGAELVIIGNGSPLFAQGFREDLDLQCPVLTDPDLVSYRAAGLRRGRVELLSPQLFTNGLRAWRTGARQTGVEGDPWQLGGVFLVRPDGATVFAQRSGVAGDHADIKAILTALQTDAPVLNDSEANSPVERLLGKGLSLIVNPTIAFSFDHTGFLVHSLGFDPDDLDVDLSRRRALVTGGNAGIGFEIAMALADLGAHVVLGCRSLVRGEEAAAKIRQDTGNEKVEVIEIDMADLTMVRSAAIELSQQALDIVVHNAGLLPEARSETPQGLETTYAVHVAGPYLLTRLLQPTLERCDDARVVWVSSGGMYSQALSMKDIDWSARDYDGVAAYAQTKRMQVVVAEELAASLADTNVTVSSMHPGWAATEGVKTSLPTFWRVMQPLLRSAAEGADTAVWLAASPSAQGRSGQFWFDREPRRTHFFPWTIESRSDRDDFMQHLTMTVEPFLEAGANDKTEAS
jgi:dehydrogenase/reductase SDR family protein 12